MDGWLRTGDVGHRRPDGFCDHRSSQDMLKPNGINVYPREIEEIIYQFPGVRECIGGWRNRTNAGERPVAFVALMRADL